MIYNNVSLLDFEAIFNHHVTTNSVFRVNLIAPSDSITVILSKNSTYNDQIVENDDRKFNIVNTKHNGGTIVVFEDGITLALLQPKHFPSPSWMNDLQSFLKSKNIDSVRNNNDIIVNGNKKVCGYSVRQLPDSIFYGIHISINADPGLISKICTKSSGKVPAGLSEFGITRKEVLEALHIESEENEL